MRKVLVIDDDEVLLAIMQNLLNDEGFNALSTADGPQGIAIYKEQRPDVVLLDLGLPSMNGMEVLRRLRSFDRKARVIVMTGYGSDELAEAALRDGAWGYVQKPIDYSNFFSQIKSALDS